MKPCISQATTLSTPFEVDVESYALAGWSAVEIWLTKLETYLQSHTLAEARALLDGHEIKAVAAASQGGLLLSRDAERAAHWDLFRSRLDLLQQLEVPTLVVAADFVRKMVPDDYGRAADSLVEAAGLATEAGVRLALEFQKGAKFCSSLDTTLALIGQSGAEGAGLGVCLDLFHYYTGPSKFEDSRLSHPVEPRLGPGLRPERSPSRAGGRRRPDLAGRGGFSDRADPGPSGLDRLRRVCFVRSAQPPALGHPGRPRRGGG